MANEGFDSWAKCVFCSAFCFPMLFIKMWTLLGKALKASPHFLLQLDLLLWKACSWMCTLISASSPVSLSPFLILSHVFTEAARVSDLSHHASLLRVHVSFFSLSWRISLSLYSSLNNLWCIVFTTDSSQGNQECYLLRASGPHRRPHRTCFDSVSSVFSVYFSAPSWRLCEGKQSVHWWISWVQSSAGSIINVQ